MKISSITTYLVNPKTASGLTVTKNLLFIKIETDEGIEGWGEAFTMLDRELSIAQEINDILPYLIGRNPFQIKDFYGLANKFAEGRGSVEFYSAVSGIEIAMWDIVGKKLGTPVYNLLGGACHDRIRVYANGWTTGTRSSSELADRAAKMVAKGFSAIKFYPFPFAKKGDLKAAYENVKAVREAVGENVDILIDIWRIPDPARALRFAEMIKDFDIYWYEEPVPSDNLEILAEIRKAIKIPVVTGECLYTKNDFRKVFESGAADIINPDITACGGILQIKEIASMAEPYYVMISPHNFNSTAIGLAATVQAAAVMPNFLIAEYFVNFEEISSICVKNPLKVENGYVILPEGAGLGIEIREEALPRHSYKRFPSRRW